MSLLIEEFDNCSDNININSNNIINLETRVKTLEDDKSLENLENRVKTLEDDKSLENLENRVNELEAKITALEKDNSIKEGLVAALSTKVNGLTIENSWEELFVLLVNNIVVPEEEHNPEDTPVDPE